MFPIRICIVHKGLSRLDPIVANPQLLKFLVMKGFQPVNETGSTGAVM